MPAVQNPPEKMMFQLTLRRRGVSDQAVLRAMEEVPRETFVEPADRGEAYRDSALSIACGQTISQPFVVAYMTEQLRLQRHHRVLEIGTGSGYQAAILSRLCGYVLSIERYRTLADSARGRLVELGCENVEVLLGDGFDVPRWSRSPRRSPSD
jgi:protein-L-isoaspartate(D-aspartate) O-methyltransferase